MGALWHFPDRCIGSHEGQVAFPQEKATLHSPLLLYVNPENAQKDQAASLWTRYSSRSTATSTAVGTATMAPTTPSSAEPSTRATRMAKPGRSTLFFMMRGMRYEFSTCR